jgi:uncharacterized membrane protein YqiK
MTSENFGNFILTLLIAVILIVIAVYVLKWLYRLSTKETAFVRTGFLGEKVVLNGGALVIPVLHEITPVNMNVIRIEVRRNETHALITKNRMRVDVIAEFFVRVGSSPQLVAAAAQTLGRRTFQPDGLRDILEGKFAGAMRTIAAQMTLEEMHEERNDYVSAVRAMASESLAANGLELESVALVDLDQTRLEFFDPSNAFDAEGLTLLTQSIENRRKMRNSIEQETLVAIRTQNLEAQRQVLDIDRESEYARLNQEREVEVRRASQRTELARERALREQESEQAQMAAREAVEKSRMVQERNLTEERIRLEEDAQQREMARRRAIEEVETRNRELTERERIASELALQGARIARERSQSEMEIQAKKSLEVVDLERQITLAEKAVLVTQAETEKRKAEIASQTATEAERVQQERGLDEIRIARERNLQALELAKRQSFEEAEIQAGEKVEQARILSKRGLDESRLVQASELRKLTTERSTLSEVAEIQKAIVIAKKTEERSAALVAAEEARAKAISAEEQTQTAREREMAERRKLTELIHAERTAQAELIAAQSAAQSEKIAAAAAAERYEVDALGQRQINEAENLLSEDARAGRLRAKLLDHLEGIVRESVRPLENIEGIKILHVDGMGSGQGSGKNVTDEVIDSALRYRVQAPMIDSLMKEIGIEGGSLGRMTDVLRDAKDIKALSRGKGGDAGSKAENDHRDEDR